MFSRKHPVATCIILTCFLGTCIAFTLAAPPAAQLAASASPFRGDTSFQLQQVVLSQTWQYSVPSTYSSPPRTPRAYWGSTYVAEIIGEFGDRRAVSIQLERADRQSATEVLAATLGELGVPFAEQYGWDGLPFVIDPGEATVPIGGDVTFVRYQRTYHVAPDNVGLPAPALPGYYRWTVYADVGSQQLAQASHADQVEAVATRTLRDALAAHGVENAADFALPAGM